MQGQNSTPSFSLNNSRVLDITQLITSTLSGTQRWSIITPTATPGTSSCTTPSPRSTSQAAWKSRVVSSPASPTLGASTPLCGIESLSTPIPDPEAHAIITNPLWMWATERNWSQRQWQLQLQAVYTPRSMVIGSCSIHRFGHSDMTYLVFSWGRLLELYMWNRRRIISGSDLEMVSYATRRIVNALAKAPHWQIIETYWNTAWQQTNICSVAFEACTKEILKEVCCRNGLQWMLHAQTGTRFEHKLIWLNPILFNQQGTT